MYYQLYYDKEQFIIEVKTIKGVFKREDFVSRLAQLGDDEVWEFNNCYKFSKNKKALKQEALDMKNGWIKELTDRIEKIEAIKI